MKGPRGSQFLIIFMDLLDNNTQENKNYTIYIPLYNFGGTKNILATENLSLQARNSFLTKLPIISFISETDLIL